MITVSFDSAIEIMSHRHHHAMGSLGGIGYAASTRRPRHHTHSSIDKTDFQFTQMELVSLEPHVTSILMYTSSENNELRMLLVKFDKAHEFADVYVYTSKPLADNERKTEKFARKVAKTLGSSRESNHIRHVHVEDLRPLFHEPFLVKLAGKHAKCIVAIVNARYPADLSGDDSVDVRTTDEDKYEAWQYLINTKGMMAIRGRQNAMMYQELRKGQYINAELFFKKNVQGALEASDWEKIKQENRYLYEPRTDSALQTIVRLDENLTEQHMKPIEDLAEATKSKETGKLDFSVPKGVCLMYVMKQLDTRKIAGDQVLNDSADSVPVSATAL